MSSSNKRIRHSPKRFGDSAKLSESSADSIEEFYKDDSFQDKTYVDNEFNGKVVATISKVSQSRTKKQKIGTSESLAKNSNHDHESVYTQVCLNDEFAAIEAVNDKIKSVEKCIDNQHGVLGTHLNTTRSAVDDCSTETTSNSKMETKMTSSTFEKSNDFGEAMSPIKIEHVFSLLNKLKNGFDAYSRESLARISILEESMLCGGINAQHKNQKSNLVKKIDDVNVFMKSNSLPILDLNRLQIFEESLKDEKFMQIAVNTCLYISFVI